MDRTLPPAAPRRWLRDAVAVGAAAVVSAVAYQLLAVQLVVALAIVAATAVLAALLLRSTPPLLVGLGALLGALASTAFSGFTPVTFANAATGGLAIALALVVPLGIVEAGRRRRDFVAGGWALAESEARARDAAAERARQRERTAIAAEMHDGLGHQLTLTAVRLARLSLDEGLPAATRAEILEIRAGAAQAAEELGRTVQLLRDPAAEVEQDVPTVAAAVERARAAGVEVRATVPQQWPEGVGASAATAATRMVEEGLANAARHAPGEPVELELAVDGDRLRVTLRNTAPAATSERRRTGGFGLLGLEHRAELLGGELAVDRTDRAFAVTMTIPTHPQPQAPATGAAHGVAEQRSRARARQVGARRRAVLLPLAIVAALAIVAVWYLVLTTTMSVLPPEAFAAIEVGDPQSQVEAVLPPMEMLDAPRDAVEQPAGSECRFYEALVSFAERADVYVVCFGDGAVTHTATVPAP